MARITIEDCLTVVPNMYDLVHVATHRSRQIYKGSDVLVDSKNRTLVTALREIAVGRVKAVSTTIDSEITNSVRDL